MRTFFLYCDHEILIERTLTKMTFSIDGQEIESVDGIFKKDHDKSFQASLSDMNGINHSVLIEYKSGGLKHLCGTLTLWLDGKKMEIRSTT